MKRKTLESYLSFNKTERLGLALLIIIIISLLIVRFSLHHFIKPIAEKNNGQKLAEKWHHRHTPGNIHLSETSVSENPGAAVIENPDTKAILFPFDPNTLDSNGFRKLGLKEKTTSILLHWRAKGKVFRKKDDLKGLYTLSKREYERLEPYIDIKPSSVRPTRAHINLNTADSATLVGLKGIGPKLAHRIIQYRTEHKRFTTVDELYEVYNFSDSVFGYLQKRLSIN